MSLLMLLLVTACDKREQIEFQEPYEGAPETITVSDAQPNADGVIFVDFGDKKNSRAVQSTLYWSFPSTQSNVTISRWLGSSWHTIVLNANGPYFATTFDAGLHTCPSGSNGFASYRLKVGGSSCVMCTYTIVNDANYYSVADPICQGLSSSINSYVKVRYTTNPTSADLVIGSKCATGPWHCTCVV